MNYTEQINALRAERDRKICEEWVVLAQTTTLRPSNMMDRLAAKYGVSHQRVENIVRAAGIYTGKKDFNQDRIAAK